MHFFHKTLLNGLETLSFYIGLTNEFSHSPHPVCGYDYVTLQFFIKTLIVSFDESQLDVVDLKLNRLKRSIWKNRGKFHGFWQTDLSVQKITKEWNKQLILYGVKNLFVVYHTCIKFTIH